MHTIIATDFRKTYKEWKGRVKVIKNVLKTQTIHEIKELRQKRECVR